MKIQQCEILESAHLPLLEQPGPGQDIEHIENFILKHRNNCKGVKAAQFEEVAKKRHIADEKRDLRRARRLVDRMSRVSL